LLKIVLFPVEFSADSLKERRDAMKAREFGIRVTRFRERQQLSITQLASRLGVDYMQVSRYEKGQSLPSLDTAVRLAGALEVSLDELVAETEPSSEPPEPLFRNKRLLERMRGLESLPPERQELALRVLDTVIAGHELESLAQRLPPA
jgi:transcriptional regulator with XRE-family HTH domain